MQLTVNRKIDKWLGYLLIAAFIPVTRLLGILLRRNHSIHKAPKQILFIKLMGLGSLVVASDAVKAVRQRFPATKLILLTEHNIGEGIKPFGVFDEIWRVDTGGLGLGALRYLYRMWRMKDWWVADMEVYSKLTTVYALMTMARNRFGFYLEPVFFRRYLNTHNVLFNRKGYLEDNYWSMTEAMTGVVQSKVIVAPVRGAELNKPYILINNTCSELALSRKLPEETLAAVCAWIVQHTPYQVAFLGTEKDRVDIDKLIDGNSRMVNMAGVFDFESYYRFMAEKGVCLVSIDSGPLHMARKLGLPTVSVWGPTNPGNYLKVREGEEKRHLSLYLEKGCSPCVHYFERLPCGGNHYCMKEVKAEAVIGKLKELLDYLRTRMV